MAYEAKPRNLEKDEYLRMVYGTADEEGVNDAH
jgi:hypothetical protein